MPCYRCGRRGHNSSQCYARFHLSGAPLQEEEEEESEVLSSYSDDNEYEEEEEMVWCCNYCHREFSTEQGARFHEIRWCKHVAPRRGVYVLVLDDGTRYVGKSENMSFRIEQHLGGAGASAWCAKGGTARARREAPCTPPMQDLNLWEQKETVEQMLRHGCNRVRGWEFTQCAPLTRDQLATLESLVFGSRDACRKCGRAGHFASRCYATTLAPWLRQLRQ